MISNRMTKQIAIAAGFLTLTIAPGIGRAQGSSQPAAQDQTPVAPAAPGRQQGREHGAMAGLNLTEDQKAAIKSIREKMKSQMDALHNDDSMTADQKAAKVHELRRSARVQTAKLLTPEQRQQMRANIRALRVARRERRQQPQPPPQG